MEAGLTTVPLPPIDWTQPWLAPYADLGRRVSSAVTTAARLPGAVAQALTACVDAPPVRFVTQADLPAGEAYEAFIRRTASVPTRDNLHDLFNGLVWQAFAQTKVQLNRVQSAEIERLGVGAVRGPVRDAVTLFDENGAILLAPEELWTALLARDWRTLFVTLRPLWRQARLVLVGHALMEQLVFPRKPLTAHVLIEKFASIQQANERQMPSSAALDAQLAHLLTPSYLATKPFTPLPVLGVPGWWPDNETPAFYDDQSVFRPRRPVAAA